MVVCPNCGSPVDIPEFLESGVGNCPCGSLGSRAEGAYWLFRAPACQLVFYVGLGDVVLEPRPLFSRNPGRNIASGKVPEIVEELLLSMTLDS